MKYSDTASRKPHTVSDPDEKYEQYENTLESPGGGRETFSPAKGPGPEMMPSHPMGGHNHDGKGQYTVKVPRAK
jgi:hypothetical protein